MTSLTDRAALALRRARAADPDFDTRPADPYRATRRHDLTRLTATSLGLDPVMVTVTDDPNRSYGGWLGFLITLTDPHSPNPGPRFITRVGTDQLLVLGPCPGCPASVPVAEIGGLADLGLHLEHDAHGRSAPPQHRPPEFATDPAHLDGCPHRA
jgi:hypothetical protein